MFSAYKTIWLVPTKQFDGYSKLTVRSSTLPRATD